MVLRILRRRGVILLVLILAGLAYWKLHPHGPKVISIGYISDRSVMLWNTLAQVRQPVEALHYGERLEVLRQEGTAAQVRTSSGTIGWLLDAHLLMDPELWDQSASLLARSRMLPVQARGHTKTVSNVRIEPGRDGKRIFQLMRGTPIVVLGRKIADAPQATDDSSQDEKGATGQDQKNRQEDWLLILRTNGPVATTETTAPTENSATQPNRASRDPVSSGPDNALPGTIASDTFTAQIAGWVLARFIELDLPGPVRDNASSADLHVVAWFELNRVANGLGGEAPQYLVAGSRGGGGQSCDFTLLRVYTWSAARKRYETAFIESDLCGRLPIGVSHGEKGPEFRFAQAGDGAGERKYVMQQTAVRRVKNESTGASAGRRKTP
jgi:hypothetical protein